MQLGPPADQPVVVGRLPEPRDQAADQELLGQAHPGVRRHLEGPQLDQAPAAAGRVGRVQLVDAELGPVRVARDVDQQVAEDAVDQPRGSSRRGRGSGGRRSPSRRGCRCAPRRRAGPGSSGRRTGPRRGTTATDGCASSATRLRSRSGRRRSGLSAGVGPAEDDVVAAAGAGVPAVEHELLGRPAASGGPPRRAIVVCVDQLVPASAPGGCSPRSRPGRA